MGPKTRIVCTIGPASSSLPTLRLMLEAGMNIARLNFSHGTRREHEQVIEHIRRLRRETGRNIGILQDLRGPKIRTGELPAAGLELRAGQTVLLVPAPQNPEADPRGPATVSALPRIPITYPHLMEDIAAGDEVLLDDGRIGLTVERRIDSGFECRVRFGGKLLARKGVAFPGVALTAHPPTAQDLEDLRFGMEQGVDFVALSFVQSGNDLLALREHAGPPGAGPRLVAKLERRAALENLDGILEAADAVMVARGDLGIVADLSMIPIYQKQIIRKANLQRVQVITATQMLESMIRNPLPTRAEVTDVANAIYDGSDAIMLSGETAVGNYPVETVRFMRRIADRVEANLGLDRSWFREESEYPAPSEQAAVARAVCATAEKLQARCIVAQTVSGHTARLISQNRPSVPIVALTPRESTFYQLSLAWGVESVLVPAFGEDFLETIRLGEAVLKEKGWVREGDLVVVSAGLRPDQPGGTNIMKLHRVG